ncbi:MAG: M81 family metallopeptidase [Verrucomicrobia bacterium]|nr:M81 family metallopeptidase [Verrucomicrobiota bacterium]
MHKRVLFAGLFHETNTFVEQPTRFSDFQVLRGEELLGCAGDSSPLGGALESARRLGWTVIPVVDFRAPPGGVVEDEVVEVFWREFRRTAEPQLEARLDGIFLVLHGAMVSQSVLDVEGEVLARIRRLPGAAELPVFGVFDLHANFTQWMADHSNGLIAYRENPHTDARESAQRAVTLLGKTFDTGRIPKTYWSHPPIMWPPTGTGTASEPMLSLERLARQIESTHENIWAVNILGGFSFADIPETGVGFSVVTVGIEAEARTILAQLNSIALQRREQGFVIEPTVESVMPQVLSVNPEVTEARSITDYELWVTNSDLGPPSVPRRRGSKSEAPGLTVLVEPSDNIGAGAPGDGTGLLRALVRYKATNAAIAINDPEAVQRLRAVPIGTQLTTPIGGRGSTLDPGPLELAVELVSRSDGKFRLEDKQSHLASMAGDSFDMGPCAVVRHGGILILLTSRKTPPFDLGQWRSQGINPENLSVIGVKAAVAHRRAYDPIAARTVWVDTPGPCRSHLKALPYRRVQRPIHPLDE